MRMRFGYYVSNGIFGTIENNKWDTSIAWLPLSIDAPEEEGRLEREFQ